MKTRIGTKCMNVLVVMLFLLGTILNGVAPVSAQTGTVAAAATASNTAPAIGTQITVSVSIDMTGTSELLGSYTGSLTWNPAVLSYASYSGAPPAGFTGVVNAANVGTGSIAFNGANASGGSGILTVLVVTFNVIGGGGANLDLAFSVMGAALTFVNLIPILSEPTASLVTVPAAPTGLVELDGAPSSGTGAANATSVSFPHTTGTGNNRLMLVGVSWNAGSTARTISSVQFTYDTSGVLDFSVVRTQQTGSQLRYSAIYKSTTEPPLNKAGTLTVTFSGAVTNGIVAGAANFKGVDQTTPLGTDNGATATSTTPSVTLTGLDGNELIFDNLFVGGNPPPTPTTSTGQSQLTDWNKTVSNTRGAASVRQSDGISATMAWTVTSNLWAITAVAINPTLIESPTCYALTLQKAGFSGTDITTNLASSPGCPSGQYVEGQVIGLTAHPDWGYEVQSWAGTNNDISTALTNVLTMPAAGHVVTVTYQSKDCFGLELTAGAHGGVPTANPTSSQACTNGPTYVEGEVITLTADPDTGYQVASWSGTDNNASKALTNTLTMPAGAAAVHVTYEEKPPEVEWDGTAHSNTANPNSSGVSIEHTTGTGDNRLMLVGVSWNSGNTNRTISSIIFDQDSGADLELSEVKTQLYSWTASGSTSYRTTAIYKLLAPPAGSTGSVVITFSGAVSNGIIAGVANFKGVDQTTPLGTPNGAVGTGTSTTGTPNPAVTLPGLTGTELVFDSVFIGASDAAHLMTADSGQSELWNVLGVGLASNFNARGAASTKPATVGDVTMSWTTSGYGTTATRWAIAAVPINPAVSVATQTLTMALIPAGGGTVTPAVGAHTYPQGTVVPISAVPATGYDFNYWTPDDNPDGPIANPYAASTTVTMDADYTVTAHFAPTTHTVTFMPNGATGGTMAPQTASVPTALTSNTFTRTGYVFVNWNTAVDGSGIDYADGADYDFSEDITLYAQWTDLGTIIIEKQTIPDGHVQTFQFTGDLTGTISDGQQIVVNGLAAGPHQVQEVVYSDQWTLQSIVCNDGNSTPDLPNNRANITLEAGETVTCVFTNRMPMEYGDAPDGYKTLSASDGARHIYTGSAIWLGSGADFETDGQPTALANGDDTHGGDDEDGVVFSPSTLVAGAQAQVTINGGPTGGKLDAWIDFNGNGVFDHPSELFLGATMTLSSGAGHAYIFLVPANAAIGFTYARFRLSTAGGLQPFGIAADGEVEDYRIQIVAPPQSHTVTFVANGGEGTMAPQVANTSTALTANTFTRDGYTFADWDTIAGGGGDAYENGATYDFAADMTLYAQWTANQYTVTFNANGGNPPEPPSKIVTYTGTYGVLATTSRTDYTFAGWYTAASSGTEVTAATTVATASNHTLFAHWTANTYTVTFDANDGTTPVPPSKTVTFDSAYGVLATTSRTGYTFAGWFTAAVDGTEVTSTTTVETADDHTLFAHWTNLPTVTVTADAGQSKVYGTIDPSAFTYTYAPSNPPITFTGALSRVVGENAGTYAITQGNLAATGYTIIFNSTDFTITKKAASVTPNAASKVYGAAEPALTGTLTGFLVADNVTGVYSRTPGETVASSPYTISAVLSPSGVLGNYNITYNTANFTITKKAASVSPNAASKVYGNVDPALTGTLTGFLVADNVSAVYNRAVGETVAGGPYVISAVLSPSGVLGNYEVTYNNAFFTITKKAASVTPNAVSKVYGAAEPALTGTLTGFLPADSVTAVYSRTPGETVSGSPYTISAVLSPSGVLGNYDITYNTANFTISLRPITVKADDKSKFAGEADPAFTCTITSGSLAFSDTFSGDLTRVSGEAVGTYPINQGTLAINANYNMTFVPGTLTISAGSVHQIDLVAGWNLVSLNLIPTDPAIEVVLADILDDVALVYAWNGATDSWLRFDPLATYGNTLDELHETMGFWIKMDAAAPLSISGTEPGTTNIPLYIGWNLIGYPAQLSRALPGALTAIAGKYNLVMAFHANDVADPWKLYDPGVPPWVSDLTAMAPGWGYWINATQAATLPVVFE